MTVSSVGGKWVEMGKKKNKDNDIIVSFLGASKSEVTGSCVSVSYPKNDGTRGLVILECGLPQGEPTVDKQYQSCKRMLEGIGKEVVQSSEYVLLGHAHCRRPFCESTIF